MELNNKYESPEIVIIEIQVKDIITTSFGDTNVTESEW